MDVPMHIALHFAPAVTPGMASQQTSGGLQTAAPHGIGPPGTVPPSPPLLLLPASLPPLLLLPASLPLLLPPLLLVLLPPLLLVLLPPDDEPLLLLLVPDELPLPPLPELPPELSDVVPDELPLPELLPLPPSSPDGVVVDEPEHAIAMATPNPMDAVERILPIRMKAILLCCLVARRRPHVRRTSREGRPRFTTNFTG
jgi:hypothetical protein